MTVSAVKSESYAKLLLRQDAPDLAEKVDNGEMTVKAATEQRKARSGRVRKSSKPAPKADRPDVEDKINEFEDRGEKYSAKDVVDAIGGDISVDTVERKQKAVRAAREAADVAAPLDWGTIPGNQREKLDRAKVSIRRALEKEFRTRLLAELDQYRAQLDSDFATHKAAYDAQNQKINAMRDDERRRYQEGIEVYRAKGLITPDEYSLIRSCLHPDSRNSLTDEKLAAAFRVFNDSRIKTLLVKEK